MEIHIDFTQQREGREGGGGMRKKEKEKGGEEDRKRSCKNLKDASSSVRRRLTTSANPFALNRDTFSSFERRSSRSRLSVFAVLFFIALDRRAGESRRGSRVGRRGGRSWEK